MHQSQEEIDEYKAEVEADVSQLLEEAGSEFTLDDVKDLVYNEKETGDMQKIIAMFDTGEEGGPELSTILEVVSDSWNYFPHKILDGLSPAEMSLKHKNK